MKIIHYTLIALIAFVPSAVWAKAKITVKPDTDHPKGTVAVKGAGFDANESIDVRWDGKKLLFTVNSDGSGNFAKQKAKVPGSALPGAHTINGKGANGDSAKAAFTVSTPWVEQGFTPSGTRDNAYENVISTNNVASLASAWTAQTGDGIQACAAVANGIVYIGSDQFYALDAATGAVLWTASLGGKYIESSAAVANGVVYVGGGDDNLYAFNAATGSALWTATTGGVIDSSPAVANGVVYVGTDSFSDHQLYAFDATTGTELWAATAQNSVRSPAVANGVVYVGGGNSLYAFDAATGNQLWSVTIGNQSFSSPAVSNGVVYVSGGEDLYAFDASTGSTLWNVTTGGSSPAVANGVVYAGSGDDLYAVDAATGSTLWTATTGGVVSSPALANGVVYVGSEDDNLYAFDASTGKVLLAATLGSEVSYPAISDGVVYAGTLEFDNKLYAFALGGNDAAYKERHALRLPYAPQHPDLH